MNIASPSEKEKEIKGAAEKWLKDLGYDPVVKDEMLSPYESEFLKQVTLGNNLARMEGRTPERPKGEKTIRAALIRWLCSEKDAQALVWPEGICIQHTIIEGEKLNFLKNGAVGLDLSSLKVPFPIVLHHCLLPDWFLLQGTDIPFLDLDGCEIGSIKADVLKVRGDLYMRCVDHRPGGGVILLLGATIGGDLDLGGARLQFGGASLNEDEKHRVLNAEGIKVEGDIHFTPWVYDDRKRKDKFSAEGGISLDEAQIGSDLKCNEASLTCWDKDNKKIEGDALTLRGATVKGHIHFSNGFRSVGAVRLPGAEIGQSIHCNDGHFCNEWVKDNSRSGVALELDGASIKLDLKLSGKRNVDAASACGTISLIGAKIGRVFDCRYGRFRQSDLADGDAEHRWTPALNLESAHVGELSYDLSGIASGNFAKGQLSLDGFVYDRIDSVLDPEMCLKWIHLQYRNRADFRSQPYLQLAKYLRETGKNRDARHILTEMEWDRPRPWKWSRPFSKLWGIIQWAVIGYGYRPGLALAWVVFLTLIGGVVYWHAAARCLMTPTDWNKYNSLREAYVHFQPFLYSLENSQPLVKFGQADQWQIDPVSAHDPRSGCPSKENPTDQMGSESFFRGIAKLAASVYSTFWSLRTFRATQIMIGWALATMGVLGVSGLIRKD